MKLLTSIAIATCAITTTVSAETTIADIVGRWQTELAEQPSPDGSASAYIRQTIDFSETREAYSVEAFGDPDGTIPLFTYVSEGPYRVVSEHASIDGAIAIDLENDTSLVTIFVDAPDLWAAINLADCPLAIGEAISITECVTGPPFQTADCIDLDLALVDMDGTRLRMGEGSVDRCNTRPEETSEIAFFRSPE